MAARDKLGSTVSLQQGIAAQSGAEAIPREYHRKVLKKIAQLTKVGGPISLESSKKPFGIICEVTANPSNQTSLAY